MEQQRSKARRMLGPSTPDERPSKKMAVDGESDDTRNTPMPENSLILRTILKNLSIWDIHNCSLVSKRWNYEAPCVLRDFYTSYAGVEENANPCLALKELDTDLSRMSIIPYTGLTIRVAEPFHNWSNCVGSKNVYEYYDFIVNRWPFRHLDVLHGMHTAGYESCRALQLSKIILREKSGSLQNLLVECNGGSRDYFSTDCNATGRLLLPKLKVLKVDGWQDFPNLLPLLISAAPNLEELWLPRINSEELKLLPRDKVKLVKTLLFMPVEATHEDLYEEFARVGPQLYELRVLLQLDFRELEQFWNIFILITESSSDSLTTLTLPSLAAVMLGKLAVKPLGKLLPNLASVSVCPDDTPELYIPDDFIAGDWRVDVDGTAAIRRLDISEDCFQDYEEVQFLSEMFPNIEGIEAVMAGSKCEVLRGVWNSWLHLKSIQIRIFEFDSTNVDATFCGIHPEEVAFLRGKTEKFLRKVHVVPIRPSITCCRKLKELNIFFAKDPLPHGKIRGVPLFLSKVTGLVAFKRMTDLKVAVVLDNCSVLKHLKPFATVSQWGL